MNIELAGSGVRVRIHNLDVHLCERALVRVLTAAGPVPTPTLHEGQSEVSPERRAWEARLAAAVRAEVGRREGGAP